MLNHLVLAFVLATQLIWLSGCARTVEVFKCKCDCVDSVLECSSNERKIRIKEL